MSDLNAVWPAVYLATPVRDAAPERRRLNYLRAVTLARLAASEHLAPLVPALTVGAALEGFQGAERGPDHPDALTCCRSLLRAVKVAGGRLWVLTRDDGSLSGGCAVELQAWRSWLGLEGGTHQQAPDVLRWRDLEDRMVRPGLHEVWSLLLDENDQDLPYAEIALGFL